MKRKILQRLFFFVCLLLAYATSNAQDWKILSPNTELKTIKSEKTTSDKSEVTKASPKMQFARSTNTESVKISQQIQLSGGNYISLPFFDGFEDTTPGWNTGDFDGDENTWLLYTIAEYSYSGSNSLGVASYESENNDWVATPTLTLPANEEIKFSLMARSMRDTDLESFEVHITTDGGNFTKIATETNIPTHILNTHTILVAMQETMLELQLLAFQLINIIFL